MSLPISKGTAPAGADSGWRPTAPWPRRLLRAVLLLSLVWVVSFAVSAAVGSAGIGLFEVARILAARLPWLGGLIQPDWPSMAEVIVWQIRLPRALLGSLVGGALAVAGAIFQGLLKNPLADPYTIGVSSGAAVGAAAAFIWGGGLLLSPQLLVPASAFIGAVLTVALVYRLARIHQTVAVETLILSGVVVGSFMSAILSFMLTRAYSNLDQVIFWLMGSLSLRGWREVTLSWPFLLAGVAVTWLLAKELNAMTMGEETARSLGVDVERSRRLLLVLGTMLTAVSVAVAGTIGFVGLVVPHVVRMVLGPDHRVLLPVAALTGAVFMLWADTVARVIIAPAELPVGVVTAFLGAPFFAYLLRTRRSGMGGVE